MVRMRPVIGLVVVAVIVGAGGAQDDFGDFDAWKKRRLAEYDRFVSEQDREFAAFLEQTWSLFDAESSEIPEEPPKPEDAPVRDEEPPPAVEDPTPRADLPPAPAPEPEATPAPEITVTEGRLVEAPLLGHRFPLTVDPRLAELSRFRAKEEGIADAWRHLGGTPHDPLSKQIQSYRDEYDLGDWGTALLLLGAARALYPGDPDRATLLQWFWLVKEGQDVRLAFNREGAFLLVASEYDLYGVSYLLVGGRKYYVFRDGRPVREADPLHTYQQDYPGADRALRAVLDCLPRTRPELLVKTLSFPWAGEEHVFEVTLDRHLLDYLDTFPQSELRVHFAAAMSGAAMQDLDTGLRPLLEDHSQLEAVRIILRFVQTAFAYATDQEQFGRENYLFPDQTLYYAACDCEDRSILFRYLVRELLDLEVVGLDYPGHAACGVNFAGDVRGDRFQWEGKTWVICDPTYINADPGQTMPLVRGQAPRVIVPAM